MKQLILLLFLFNFTFVVIRCQSEEILNGNNETTSLPSNFEEALASSMYWNKPTYCRIEVKDNLYNFVGLNQTLCRNASLIEVIGYRDSSLDMLSQIEYIVPDPHYINVPAVLIKHNPQLRDNINILPMLKGYIQNLHSRTETVVIEHNMKLCLNIETRLQLKQNLNEHQMKVQGCKCSRPDLSDNYGFCLMAEGNFNINTTSKGLELYYRLQTIEYISGSLTFTNTTFREIYLPVLKRIQGSKASFVVTNNKYLKSLKIPLFETVTTYGENPIIIKDNPLLIITSRQMDGYERMLRRNKFGKTVVTGDNIIGQKCVFNETRSIRSTDLKNCSSHVLVGNITFDQYSGFDTEYDWFRKFETIEGCLTLTGTAFQNTFFLSNLHTVNCSDPDRPAILIENNKEMFTLFLSVIKFGNRNTTEIQLINNEFLCDDIEYLQQLMSYFNYSQPSVSGVTCKEIVDTGGQAAFYMAYSVTIACLIGGIIFMFVYAFCDSHGIEARIKVREMNMGRR